LESKVQKFSNGEIAIEIDLEHGGRIKSLRWREFEFALPFRDDLMTWGWFAMVPWAGRIKLGQIQDLNGTTYELPTHWDPPHAEHGFGFFSKWEPTGATSSRIALPEPYAPAVATQHFELEENSLQWKLNYEPNGCDLPAWVGFHPWFPRSIDSVSSAELAISPEKMLLRGEDYLPTGEFGAVPEGPWDDAFTGLQGDPIIRWGESATITIHSDVPWWVIYTEDPLAICVEPQTAPPDAANLGILGAHSIKARFTFS